MEPQTSFFERIRRHRGMAWGMDLAFMGLVVWAVVAWYHRGLLPASGRVAAPDFMLTAVDGQTHRLEEAAGKRVLLYFFAPWCGVCHQSAPNVQAVREATREDDVAIYMVALDWPDIESVEQFATRHGLTFPVLLGTPALQRAYQVGAYPTYYVLDEQGRITGRSIGYSTTWGLRWHLG